MKRICSILLLILLTALGVRADKFRVPSEKKAEGDVRVLLIGNSFTYYHDGDDMLVDIASSQGMKIDLGEFLRGGRTFGDHLAIPETRKAINAGGYDFVFLQDQSVTPAKYSRDKDEKVLNDLISLKRLVVMKSPDSKVILERTWSYNGKEAGGFGDGETLEKHLKKGTTALSRKAHTWLSPIGPAFNLVRSERQDISLLDPDDKHQSTEGAYLKACVNYLVMTGRRFEGYVPSCNVDPSKAAYLRSAAERIVLGHERKYRIKRDKKFNPFSSATRVVAHRGFHLDNGCPENSIAALKASSELGVYGSEFDIWLTKDGKVVISHDKSYRTDTLKRVIKDTDYKDLSDIRLENGEPVPTFKAFLDSAKASRPMKLVCELKRHGSEERDRQLFDEAIAIVTKKKMKERMVWQSFSYPLCKYIASTCHGAQVIYICTKEENMKTPAELIADGISGVNYKSTLYEKHPELIKEMHALGLAANLCAEDDPEVLRKYISEGVNTVGTNVPKLAGAIIQGRRQ